ncbi:hypothetical protein [Methylobacterium sp. A54F]
MQVSIAFTLDGRPLCTCLWWHVPRRDDAVMLGGPPRPYRVLRVVWGVAPQAPAAAGVQGVLIELEPLD